MPKQVDPEQKRREITAACASVIAEEGMASATLRRVASAGDCTTGTLMHYFTQRDDLLISTLRQVHNAAGLRMAQAAAREPTADRRLAAVVDEALPFDQTRYIEWRVWLSFWAVSQSEPAFAAENSTRYTEWHGLLRQLLEPIASSDRIENETTGLLTLIDGLGIAMVRNPFESRTYQRAQRTARLLLDEHLQRLTA